MSAVPPAPKNTSPSTPVRSKVISSDPRNVAHQSSTYEGTELTPKPLSQTGRSKTAPLSLDTLWTPTVDLPQLSERDSIFATTYILTDSPGTSPNLAPPLEATTDNESEEHIPDMAISPLRRLIEPPLLRQHHPPSLSATSSPLERHTLTETLRRDRPSRSSLPFHDQRGVFAAHFNPHSSRRPGVEIEDTRRPTPPFMSPVDSPLLRPSTPHDHDHDLYARDSFEILSDNDERLKYRSWREGRPAISGSGLAGAHRSKSGDGLRVDKKIEATLPKTEQPTAPRSRKASHYLRLFKENDAAEEQKRREEREKERQAVDRVAQSHQPEDHASSDFNFGPREDTQDSFRARRLSSKDLQEVQPTSLQRGISRPRDDLLSPEASTRGRTTEPADALDANAKDNMRGLIKPGSRQEFPMRMLEEIRSHHNLTPGAEGQSSFSMSLPTAASERSRGPSVRANPNPSTRETAKYFPVIRDESRERSPASEEEESEREQISSALYFPHRQISSKQVSPEQEIRNAAIEGARRREEAIASTGKLPKGWDSEETIKTPEEVEISLQSQDENQCLHGDLQQSAPLPQNEVQKRLTSPIEAPVSLSESDYESLPESSYSLRGYESSATDDLGTTPTAKPVRRTNTMPRERTHQPPAPIGAVELKPYDHQVGGHTTVYRFSRRAVCKQLNNRENEFYETVEQHHPELLDFLPRCMHLHRPPLRMNI